ncbi:MAG: hypothetical protein QXW40_06960 [Thermofilum sp.]
MATNPFRIEELKKSLYHHVTTAALQNVMNELYKAHISPIQIPENYFLDNDYFYQNAYLEADGSFKVTNTVRYYDENGHEFYVDFIYTERNEQAKSMQIIARRGGNVIPGPVIPYNKYFETFQRIVNKLADELNL